MCRQSKSTTSLFVSFPGSVKVTKRRLAAFEWTESSSHDASVEVGQGQAVHAQPQPQVDG